MKNQIKNSSTGDLFDTNINVIGGLKDCNVIYKVIEAYFNDKESIKDLIIKRNELSLRTEKSRRRIERAITSSFLNFKNEQHEYFLQIIFKNISNIESKNLILFWQFALSNKLFFDITLNIFMKIYFSGRAAINKEDITAYLKESINQNKFGKVNWSETTTNTISTKYLNFLTKLDLLCGARNKTFKHIQLSNESLLILLYFAKFYAPDCFNVLENPFLKLSFISSNQITEKVKNIAQKGLINMSFNGVALNVELPVDFRGVNNALYS